MTRKRGRPLSAPELKRTKRVQVNMTKAEKAAVKAAADAQGLKLSAFIVAAAVRAAAANQ